jgi:hypothetical protein
MAASGSLRLSVLSVRLNDPVRLYDPSDDPFQLRAHEMRLNGRLVIWLKAENVHPTQILDYPTWGDLAGKAELADSFGNQYRYSSLGRLRAVGAAADNRIRPQTASADLLVFEQPVDKADDLFLTVPAPDHTDFKPHLFRFRIPRPLWAK